MKKAMFLVLVVVLVFAVAAPAFAAMTLVSSPSSSGGTIGVTNFAVGEVQVEILPAMEIWIDPVANYSANLSAGPGGSDATDLFVTVKSNQAFHKSYQFGPLYPATTVPAIFDEVHMYIDNVNYSAGTALPCPLGIDNDTVKLDIGPGWISAAGSGGAELLITATQD